MGYLYPYHSSCFWQRSAQRHAEQFRFYVGQQYIYPGRTSITFGGFKKGRAIKLKERDGDNLKKTYTQQIEDVTATTEVSNALLFVYKKDYSNTSLVGIPVNYRDYLKIDIIEDFGEDSLNRVLETLQNHYSTILNYFENRFTNASGESFNTKIKALRSQFRGVDDIRFFMFRLAKLYA